jgi:hypothetical protein
LLRFLPRLSGGMRSDSALPGIVEKVIKSPDPTEPERAQIVVENAEHLYKEIRIENSLKDANGNDVTLKQEPR